MTEKQMQLLQMLAGGYSLKEAAVVLDVSQQLLISRAASLRAKMQAKTNAHLVAKCLRAGLIV